MFGQELLIQVLLCNYLSQAYRWESEGSGGGVGWGQWGGDRVGEKRTGKMGEGGKSRKIEGGKSRKIEGEGEERSEQFNFPLPDIICLNHNQRWLKAN